MHRKLTEKEVCRIRQMNEMEFSRQEISKIMDVPVGSISYYIRRTENPSVQEKKRLESKVLKLKKSGKSLDKTATLCNISNKKVQAILDKKIGSHRYVSTAYPAVTTWMNSNGLLKKDIAFLARSYNNDKPILEEQIFKLLDGVLPLSESVLCDSRCHAKAAIVNYLMAASGMSFEQLFGERIPVTNINNRSVITFKNCKYKALSDWISNEKVSIQNLAAIAGVSYQTMRNLLTGRTILTENTMTEETACSAAKLAIQTLLEYSGMTYKKAFAEVFEQERSRSA